MLAFYEKCKKILDICKLHCAYVILYCFKSSLVKKDIWLICEKETEARDNGYHFFKYLREKRPEINAYYVIVKGTADFNKVQKYGNIIEYNSFEHYIYYLAARVSANSQPFGAAPSVPTLMHRFSYLRRKNQKVVFLQHGIIKDELSHYLDFSKAGFDIFTCSSGQECDFIRKTYGYPNDNAQLLGLCRYDSLFESTESEKQILIMPTFRKWLKAKNTAFPATQEEKERFIESEFYVLYSKLLSNERLKKICVESNYKVVFYPHYALQSYIDCFKTYETDYIIIADRNSYDVQRLLIDSRILITDFSSVFFDFAYMEKPTVFFQFDEEKYRGSHYKKGYFDYRDNGFGSVVTTIDALIDEIESLIKRNGEVSEFYLERINDFFDLRDNKNCERTYAAIIKKLEEG